ncbi:MAG: hypothetical protein ACRCZ9_03050 [Fusobacteriaceae bacterium]
MFEYIDRLGKDTIVCLLIIILFFIWQLKYVFKIGSLNKEIKRFEKISERLKKSMHSEKDLNFEKDSKSRKDVEREIKNKIYLEYQEEIERSGNWRFLKDNIEDYSLSLKNRGLSSVEPSEYFNEQNILDRNFNLQGLNQVGPTLIGFGIMGTFIGLILGLYQIGTVNNLLEKSAEVNEVNDVIDVVANKAATENMLSGISKVIPSMSLAFVTSLAGMGLSLIYTFIYKRKMGYVLKGIHQIEHNLSVIFPATSQAESLLVDIRESLESFGSNLEMITGGSGIREAQKQEAQIWQGIGGGIQKSIGNMGDTIGKQLKAVFNEGFIKNFEDLDRSLKTTISQMEASNEAFKILVEEVPAIVKNFKIVGDTSSKIFKNSQDSMLNYDKFINGTGNFIDSANLIFEVQKELNISTQKLGQINLTTSNKYQEVQSSMYEMFNDFKESIKNSSESTVEIHKNITFQINEVLDRENQKIGKTFSDFSSSIDLYSRKTMEIDNQIKDVVDNFRDIYVSKEDYYNNQYGKISEAQVELVAVIEKSLKSYGEVVSKINGDMVEVIKNMRNMK